MAVRAFAVQNVPDNADLARQAISSLVPNGGGLVQSGDLSVAQTSTPSMTVNVGIGRCWIDGTNLSHLSGAGYGNQGQYFLINDSLAAVTLATANGTNPRIDIVYAAVPDSYYSGSSNTPVITVATGTPVSGASYPANAPTLPYNSMPLAWIYVGAGVSSVANANITTIIHPTIGPTVPVSTSLGGATGFQVVGSATLFPFPGRSLVTVSGYINRTGSSIVIPGGSVSFTSLATIVPAGFTSSFSQSFAWNGYNQGSGYFSDFQMFYTPSTGVLAARGDGGNVTWYSNSQINFHFSYAV